MPYTLHRRHPIRSDRGIHGTATCVPVTMSYDPNPQPRPASPAHRPLLVAGPGLSAYHGHPSAPAGIHRYRTRTPCGAVHRGVRTLGSKPLPVLGAYARPLAWNRRVRRRQRSCRASCSGSRACFRGGCANMLASPGHCGCTGITTMRFAVRKICGWQRITSSPIPSARGWWPAQAIGRIGMRGLSVRRCSVGAAVGAASAAIPNAGRG